MRVGKGLLMKIFESMNMYPLKVTINNGLKNKNAIQYFT